VSKETYYSVKRDLLYTHRIKRDEQCQKRPTTVSKETYSTPTASREMNESAP
jgi:hypothetical protein